MHVLKIQDTDLFLEYLKSNGYGIKKNQLINQVEIYFCFVLIKVNQ